MADEPRSERSKQVAAQRRRRGDSEMRADKRLPIPPEVAKRLKSQGLEPRWVNDTGNRMHQLTVQDDYDPVEGVEPVPVGTDPHTGQPIMARLLAKRADFIKEDREKRAKTRDETETSLLRGEVPATGGDNPRPAGPSPTYVAKGTSISRGNQILE